MTQLAVPPVSLCQDEMPLLLACLRAYFGTASTADLHHFTEPDWQMLTQKSIASGVMPLFYQALKGMESLPISKSHLLQFQHLNRLNGLHNVSQFKELLRVLNLLRADRIKAIAFKGPVLAISAYGNVALRQFNDLDVLVKLEDFWKAMAVLTANGYQSDRSRISESAMFARNLQVSLQYCDSEATLLNRHFQPSLLHSNLERSLDLHWGIQPRRVWNVGRFALLWQHQKVVTLMGQSVQTFSPEAMLVMLCVSVARETGKRSLKQICDIAQIIRAHPELDWETALKLAAGLRCQRLFRLGLSITQALLHMPLPDLLQPQMPVLQSATEHMFQSDSEPTHPFVTEFTSQFNTLDRPWDALFLTVHLLRLLLMPRDPDHKVLLLSTRWTFLYYIFRPVRLLVKYALALLAKLSDRYRHYG